MKSKPGGRRDGKTAGVASEAARKAWITRRKNEKKGGRVEGKKKRVVLLLDKSLLTDMETSCGNAHDLTLAAGIRRAIQDYNDKHLG